jgi:hypothetical protein
MTIKFWMLSYAIAYNDVNQKVVNFNEWKLNKRASRRLKDLLENLT